MLKGKDMVQLELRKQFDESELETGSLALGYKQMALLFNAGPFPGGGDCLIVESGGEIMAINSNDLIHDLDAYRMMRIP